MRGHQIRLLGNQTQQKPRMFLSGDVLPPLGFATLPVCSKRWAQSTTTLGLTP
jgi:hypothetical protein